MQIDNNLIRSSDYPNAERVYAINIVLKSGSVLYLDGIKPAEKEAYLEYALLKEDKLMVMRVDDEIWRLIPSDIEKICINSYGANSFKATELGKKFLSESIIPSGFYLRMTKIAIMLFIINFILGGVKIFTSGNPVEVLLSKELIAIHISRMFSGVYLSYLMILLVMIVANVVDFFFPSKMKYGIYREYDNGASGRFTNITIALSFAVAAYIGIAAFEAIVKSVF